MAARPRTAREPAADKVLGVVPRMIIVNLLFKKTICPMPLAANGKAARAPAR
jgi:hypothetical protein